MRVLHDRQVRTGGSNGPAFTVHLLDRSASILSMNAVCRPQDYNDALPEWPYPVSPGVSSLGLLPPNFAELVSCIAQFSERSFYVERKDLSNNSSFIV
jgi:hypothetical protein